MTAQGAARSNAYLSLPTRRQATGSIDAIPPAPRTGPIHWWSARLIDGTFAAMGRYSRSPYFAFGGCLFLLFMWVVWVLPIAVMFAWVVVLAGLQVITAMVEGITWLVLWPFTRKREPAKLAKILVMSAVVFVALVIVSVVSSSGNTATLGPAAHGQGQGSGSQPKARPGQHHHRGSAGSAAAGCHARDHGKLPDRHCTPGAVNPHVTQADIASTICVTGWTDIVRPSESYTEALKTTQIARYHYANTSTSVYEEDHLIPLDLGGSPSSPRNLWPEYDGRVIPDPKDAVENALNAAVCNGSVSLRAAQNAIAVNWIRAEARLGIGSGGGSAPAPAPSAPAPEPTTAAPVGCYPKTDSGNCYSAGEFCRTSDAGVTGVAGNGERIVCRLNGSRYRWEPA